MTARRTIDHTAFFTRNAIRPERIPILPPRESTEEINFPTFGHAVTHILKHWAGITFVGGSLAENGFTNMGDLLVWDQRLSNGEPIGPKTTGGCWEWPANHDPAQPGTLRLRWWKPRKPVGGQFQDL